MRRIAIGIITGVFVGLLLVGLGFYIGRSKGQVTTTPTTVEQSPSQNSAWWNQVKAQVIAIYNDGSQAYTEWSVFCTPGFSYVDCHEAVPYLKVLNQDCNGFNPSSLGATQDEVLGSNRLEATCEVSWLTPESLGKWEFDQLKAAALHLEVVGVAT